MGNNTLQSVQHIIDPKHVFIRFVFFSQLKNPSFCCLQTASGVHGSSAPILSSACYPLPWGVGVQQAAVGLNLQLQAGLDVQQPLLFGVLALGVCAHLEQLLLQAADELLHLGQLAAVVALGFGQRVLQGFLLHMGEKWHRRNNGGDEMRKAVSGLTNLDAAMSLEVGVVLRVCVRRTMAS